MLITFFFEYFAVHLYKIIIMKKVAIFASGSGSNAENIINYYKDSREIFFPLILTNKADAYICERAKNLNVLCIVFQKQDMSNGVLLKILKDADIDFIVLAGFLLKVSDEIIAAYPKKIVNIHPALLPKFGGKGMYGDRVHEAVVEAGETESGITIHYIDNHYDAGTIIFQAKCEVLPSDKPSDVATKVHALEYANYPRVIGECILRDA